MNVKVNNIEFLIRLLNIFNRIGQLSYVVSQTKDRFPPIRDINPEQAEEFFRILLALGYDVDEINTEIKKMKAQYDQSEKAVRGDKDLDGSG